MPSLRPNVCAIVVEITIIDLFFTQLTNNDNNSNNICKNVFWVLYIHMYVDMCIQVQCQLRDFQILIVLQEFLKIFVLFSLF